MVDIQDLKSCGAMLRAGSIPARRTIIFPRLSKQKSESRTATVLGGLRDVLSHIMGPKWFRQRIVECGLQVGVGLLAPLSRRPQYSCQ